MPHFADGFYRIVNVESKTCLDVVPVGGTAGVGTAVTGWAVVESKTSQLWTLTNDSVLTHYDTKLQLGFSGKNPDCEDDDPVVLTTNPPHWVIKREDCGNLTVHVKKTDAFLDLHGGRSSNATDVRLKQRHGHHMPHQSKWNLKPALPPSSPSASGLVTHIVCFNLPNPPEAQEVARRFVALKDECLWNGKPYILSLSGGANNSPENAAGIFTHAWVLTFADLEARDYYVFTDPAHQSFKAFVGPILAPPEAHRAFVLDYVDGVYDTLPVSNPT